MKLQSNCRHQNIVLNRELIIYKFGLLVCLYLINVKTAEPIRPKRGNSHDPGMVYGNKNLFCNLLMFTEIFATLSFTIKKN